MLGSESALLDRDEQPIGQNLGSSDGISKPKGPSFGDVLIGFVLQAVYDTPHHTYSIIVGAKNLVQAGVEGRQPHQGGVKVETGEPRVGSSAATGDRSDASAKLGGETFSLRLRTGIRVVELGRAIEGMQSPGHETEQRDVRRNLGMKLGEATSQPADHLPFARTCSHLALAA